MNQEIVFVGACVPLLYACPVFEQSNPPKHPNAIRWLRAAETEKLPEIAQAVAHPIFRVDNLGEILDGAHAISDIAIDSNGEHSVFIEINGIPIKLLSQDDRSPISEDAMTAAGFKYHSFWIPSQNIRESDVHLPDFQMFVNHDTNKFGVGWVRYEKEAPYHDLIKTVPHPAFEVDGMERHVDGKTVLIPPKKSQPGLTIAFVDVEGFPIEYLEIDRTVHPDGV